MKKNGKRRIRILPAVLCVAIVLAMIPAVVFATDGNDLAAGIQPEPTTVTTEPTPAPSQSAEPSSPAEPGVDATKEPAAGAEPKPPAIMNGLDSGTQAANNTDYGFDPDSGTLSVYTNEGALEWKDDESIAPDDIKYIELMSGVTEIPAQSFAQCSQLISAVIPEGVTTIGYEAFKGSSLASAAIPESVTLIDDYAFENCKLTEVTLPDGLKTIGQNAFAGCPIRSITIPSGVEAMGMYAFGTVTLESVTIMPGVREIGEAAFIGCELLESVTIPSSVKTIGAGAFYQCAKLSSVTMQGKTPPAGGENMFEGTASSLKIHVPAGAEQAYREANFWSDYADKFAFDYGYTFSYGTLSITKDIGTTAWRNDGKIDPAAVKEIQIADSVREIGDGAFEGCTSLASSYYDHDEIRIPRNIVKIGARAFAGCGSVATVSVEGKTPPVLGEGAFDGASSELMIYVPEGTEYDYQEAWKAYADKIATGGYTFLPEYGVMIIHTNEGTAAWQKSFYFDPVIIKQISIDRNVTEIIYNGFYSLSITSADIPSSVRKIGGSAFASCYSLKTITLHQGLQEIGANAFDTCVELESITIPESVKWIGSSAFSTCISLTTIKMLSAEPPALGDYALDTYGEAPADIIVPKGARDAYIAAPGWSDYADHIYENIDYDMDSWNLTICTNAGTTSWRKGLSSYISSVEAAAVSKGVTEIGDSAFSGCSSLESAVIPESVTKIGSLVFNNCKRLAHVDILSQTPPALGSDAFKGAGSAFRIRVPLGTADAYKAAWSEYSGNIEEVSYSIDDGKLIVYNAAGMTDWRADGVSPNEITAVEFSQSITKIADGAFQDCIYLSTAELPSGLTEIGAAAFKNCNLTEVNLPSGLRKIGDSAFEGCGIAEADLPESVSYIGEYAFCRTPIPSVTLPERVAYIGDGAFASCANLKKATVINKTPFAIGSNVFDGSSAIEFEIRVPVGAGAAYRSAWSDYSGSIEEPGYIFENGTLTIYENVGMAHWAQEGVASRGDVKEIVIKHGITIIERFAFQYCTALEKVNIPDSVTEIQTAAFIECHSLKTVEIPDSVTVLEEGAFESCSSLESVKLPKNLKEISKFLFNYCRKLSSVDIPDGVEIIGPRAFKESGLAAVKIPNSVKTIKEDAFIFCKSLETVTIPEGVETIGNWAFSGCSQLASVTMQGNTPPTFGNSVFSNASPDLKIRVPVGAGEAYRAVPALSGVKSNIEEPGYVFENGKLTVYEKQGLTNWREDGLVEPARVTSVELADDITEITDNAFSGCANLASITVPNTVARIGDSAFASCALLDPFDFPENMTEVGANAFEGCAKFTEITIPETITKIGANAFSGCALTSVAVPGRTPITLGDGAFGTLGMEAKIHVPVHTDALYQGAEGWSNYADHIIGDIGHIAVTGLGNVSMEGLRVVAGQEIELGAEVQPEEASFTEVEWKVKDAGTTGAVVIPPRARAAAGAHTLRTTGEGTVVLTASVTHGAAIGTPYEEDFTVKVEAAPAPTPGPEEVTPTSNPTPNPAPGTEDAPAPTAAAGTGNNAAETGDTIDMTPFIILAICAAGIVAAAVIFLCRKRKAGKP